MKKFGKLLIKNHILRTTLFALIALFLGVSSSFLATEITDGSTNPATIRLNLVFHTAWLYVTVALFILNIVLSILQSSALDDAFRYNDDAFRRALVGKVAVDYFAKKIPEMVENGEVKSLEDALKLVEIDE
ncbi:hypothetical protein [Candidatus Rhodobacter oscarellae]|uniref:hypothetical protein n=1 Tax=Candidatus Rhodobacter oscarellae TaxID=1675527 RepID=UPI000670B8F9|nr:hypothetical protein [Candidatus Rhodobacter lobularis]